LALLANRGAQTIDLEGLANHRGSLFGSMPGGQPSQRLFEGRLAMALAALDPTRPVIVEAESSRVGNLSIPKQLWSAMVNAPRVRIAAPLSARADYLARAYNDVAADLERLETVIGQLKSQHSGDVITNWRALAAAGDFAALAGDLMRRHYDPRYEKHRARFDLEREVVITADCLTPETLGDIATDVEAAVGQLCQHG
jgi:tRNA 2-selenouridine synthase